MAPSSQSLAERTGPAPFGASFSPTTAKDATSVIVPLAESTLPERWPEGHLGRAGAATDITIAAGELVPDRLVRALQRRGCTVLRSDAPRGARVRQAARATTGRVLLFLHADTRLPAGWQERVLTRISGRRPWGAFRLAFEDECRARRLRLVALGANLRSSLLGLPFGDQAPFVTRVAYESVQGHPPWPFLDDLELSLRLRRLAAPMILETRVFTSSRKYQRIGGARTVLRNAGILLRFAAGASPTELEPLYRKDR